MWGAAIRCRYECPTIPEARSGRHLGRLHVGSCSIFTDAEFTEVSHPTLRRVVMRIDLQPVGR
jgi:hypothetical protein